MNAFMKRNRLILLAAATAVPLLAIVPDTTAQYRIETGRVNDASNRVGSGGRNPNDANLRTGDIVSGNNIVTGNVTGGKEFRGDIPYADTTQFRNRTGGESLDNYIRSSAGVDGRLATDVKPFYGVGRSVEVPSGYQQIAPGSGAYVPAPTPSVTNRTVGDQRMGAVNFAEQRSVLPAPGELLMSGPVDPTAGQQFISASSLTGIRQVRPGEPGATGAWSNQAYDPVTGQLSSDQIKRMQDELRAGWSPDRAPGAPGAITQPPVGSTDENVPGQVKQVPGAEQIIQKPITPPDAVAQKPLDTSLDLDGLSTKQSMRQRILPPPQAQSSLYAELWKRHQAAAKDSEMSDAEAARLFNAARAEQQAQAGGTSPGSAGQASTGRPGDVQAARPGAGGVARPGDPPSVTPTPGGTGELDTGRSGVTDYAQRNEKILKRAPGDKPEVRKPAPIKVPTLGEGIKSTGMGDLLKRAESLMKEGKFTAALEQYAQAEQVAPNQPLVRLGRANAELGASYYARAEALLREVFTKNPELLVGQYDLTNWLGEQRLQALIKDLKEIASKEAGEPRAVFLLAYIAYNTGREQQADAYLDLADRRSGGKDPFFKLLRENWALPDKPATQPSSVPPASNK